MGNYKDLSNFDKGKIVMTRQLDYSISKTTGLGGCSWYALVRKKDNRRTGNRVVGAHDLVMGMRSEASPSGPFPENSCWL